MSGGLLPLAADQARCLHDRVALAHHQLSSSEWAVYLGLAQQLPVLLRENGLQLTVQFLQRQAGAKKAAVRLLADWLGPPESLASVAGLGQFAAGQHSLQPWQRSHPAYVTAAGLAAAEAQRLRRSAEVVDHGGSENPLGALQGEYGEVDSQLRSDRPTDVRGVWAVSRHDPWLQVQLHEHLGLSWRFAGALDGQEPGQQDQYKSRHIGQLIESSRRWPGTSHWSSYRAAFNRWEAWLGRTAQHSVVEVDGRLHLALGSPTVFETQVLLHPVHGLPYVPGSTLKGAVKAHLKRKLALLPSDDLDRDVLHQTIDTLFGQERDEQDSVAGEAVFLDAWWVPGAEGPLVGEVETPHHLSYYGGKSEVASAFDNPNPVPQLAVRGQFVVAVSHLGVGRTWAQQVLDWLIDALSDPMQGGLGGKAFAAGYGRMVRVGSTGPA